ncbi:DNA modification methylase [Microbacterium oleivorans]|uniref:DNA modification methylase n=1 Tax=Microbacterium oleivorans TaxID=273677 RepID=A0A7D5IPL9_9MICO|nr:DNA modification methylase [Microbacterium oleivorans]QLD10941.1 DNA modification methylase [Microbacterium oleivorans]
MKLRIVASIALGAALTLGATGCSMIAPQATTIDYSASDGVNIPPSGPLDIRNAMVIADESGTAGNFLAAIVNDTDEPQTLVFGFGDDTTTLRVPARERISLGVDGEEPILLEDIDTLPGATLPMSFQSGDGEGVRTEVPVLDGMLPYYTEFVPRVD